MSLDKVILKQVAGGTQSDPLWGEYQTFYLDIDNEYHRLWLNKQYKLGAVMVEHSYVNFVPEHKHKIYHFPTNKADILRGE
tara:strand:+ start:354 stop:596 length:243 start_codon:yes stop_codon:yes gene_type:complete